MVHSRHVKVKRKRVRCFARRVSARHVGTWTQLHCHRLLRGPSPLRLHPLLCTADVHVFPRSQHQALYHPNHELLHFTLPYTDSCRKMYRTSMAPKKIRTDPVRRSMDIAQTREHATRLSANHTHPNTHPLYS